MEDEAELASFLESMMGQLMSKDVLYEPVKELNEKARIRGLLLPHTHHETFPDIPTSSFLLS